MKRRMMDFTDLKAILKMENVDITHNRVAFRHYLGNDDFKFKASPRGDFLVNLNDSKVFYDDSGRVKPLTWEETKYDVGFSLHDIFINNKGPNEEEVHVFVNCNPPIQAFKTPVEEEERPGPSYRVDPPPVYEPVVLPCPDQEPEPECEPETIEVIDPTPKEPESPINDDDMSVASKPGSVSSAPGTESSGSESDEEKLSEDGSDDSDDIFFKLPSLHRQPTEPRGKKSPKIIESPKDSASDNESSSDSGHHSSSTEVELVPTHEDDTQEIEDTGYANYLYCSKKGGVKKFGFNVDLAADDVPHPIQLDDQLYPFEIKCGRGRKPKTITKKFFQLKIRLAADGFSKASLRLFDFHATHNRKRFYAGDIQTLALNDELHGWLEHKSGRRIRREEGVTIKLKFGSKYTYHFRNFSSNTSHMEICIKFLDVEILGDEMVPANYFKGRRHRSRRAAGGISERDQEMRRARAGSIARREANPWKEDPGNNEARSLKVRGLYLNYLQSQVTSGKSMRQAKANSKQMLDEKRTDKKGRKTWVGRFFEDHGFNNYVRKRNKTYRDAGRVLGREGATTDLW